MSKINNNGHNQPCEELYKGLQVTQNSSSLPIPSPITATNRTTPCKGTQPIASQAPFTSVQGSIASAQSLQSGNSLPSCILEKVGSLEDVTLLIFGYGSILWKKNFNFVAEYETYIKGYKRVFYQGSSDHRGVPGKPGRVVTLIPDPNPQSRVYGKAFQLPSNPEEILTALDALGARETGYECISIQLYDTHPPIFCHAQEGAAGNTKGRDKEVELDIHRHRNFPQHERANIEDGNQKPKKVLSLCYIATHENESYLGEAPIEHIAKEIVEASGKSGTNLEYLFRLTQCLQEMGTTDLHVFELDAMARRLLNNKRVMTVGKEYNSEEV